MKRIVRLTVASVWFVLGSHVACSSSDDEGGKQEHETTGGQGGQGGSGGQGGQGSPTNSSGGKAASGGADGGQAGAPSVCVDEYPFDDGYTCKQQAAWGKCDESWLEGYCLVSCDNCDYEPEPEIDRSGPRNVFASYTAKQSLAPTPPMGWNSWNKFGCEIDETLIKEIADAMVSSGMKDAGYEYVNIDDCWQADERAADGSIQPDPDRFPGGMKALADYVHGLGLKLGLYSDRGTETCGGRPGSFEHEIADAQTYAAWGIDYLKYDNCAVPLGREDGAEMEEDYAIMGEALRQTGRDIVYSVCAWWFHDWMPEVGHLWRTTTDIRDEWNESKHSTISLLNMSGGDTTRYGAFAESDFDSGAYAAPGLAPYAGPSAWNDPDMLEVGNGAQTAIEYRSQFSLWALMAAPLIAGNDLRNMTDETKAILTSPEVIAVNQDSLGAQGRPVSESTTLEVWSKKLSGNDAFAVVLFNRTEAAADITATWSDVGLTATSATVRDLWARSDLGVVADEYTATVPSHGVVMLKVVGQ